MKRITKSTDEINKNFLTVLVAEGHNSVRESLHNGLKRYNYNVLSAKNGVEAKDKLTKQKVHVIITDLILPQISGFEVLRIIQEHRNDWGGFPFIIVVTGADTPDNESEAEALGADEFIPKPVTIEEVAQRLAVFQKRLVYTDRGYQFRQPHNGKPDSNLS